MCVKKLQWNVREKTQWNVRKKDPMKSLEAVVTRKASISSWLPSDPSCKDQPREDWKSATRKLETSYEEMKIFWQGQFHN